MDEKITLFLEMAAGPALPEWIRLLPLGTVELVDDREPFTVDPESLRVMVEAYRQRGVDLVIDYEHQSLKGERAPAAGWIKDLEAREDGLWARVEWTGQAEEYLKAREYRYFSPVLRLDAKGRKPLALLHVGLTNVPAIKGLSPLVARYGGEELPAAEPQSTAGLTYLALQRELRTAQMEEEQAEVQERIIRRLGGKVEESLAARVEEFLAELARALNLAEEATAADIMAGVQAMGAGSEKAEAVQEELAALKAQLREEVVSRVVEEALSQGKISPAQRSWAVEYCRQDMVKFEAYVAGAPKVVPVGEELPSFGEGEPGSPGLTAPELTICRSMGILPEIFHEAKAEMERARK